MNQSSDSLPVFDLHADGMKKLKDAESETNQPSEAIFGEGDHLVVPVDATPKARRRGLVPVLLVFLLTLMGAIIGFLAARYAFPLFSDLGNLGVAWLIVILALLFYVVLIIHECGHLLGGRLVGSRFMLLIVGPLRILREQQGIRVSLNKNLAAYGGMARVEAAVLLAEGRKDEARIHIQEGLRNVKHAMYLGSGRLEEVLLRSLLSIAA
jgi:hypothetical protein